ncbi:hypothetical protein ACQPZF_11225 [Actinosynnema sp. CS-041913]
MTTPGSMEFIGMLSLASSMMSVTTTDAPSAWEPRACDAPIPRLLQ